MSIIQLFGLNVSTATEQSPRRNDPPVKFGETLRRFNTSISDKKLVLDTVQLKEKIRMLFSFGSDVEFSMTYVDEDGDVGYYWLLLGIYIVLGFVVGTLFYKLGYGFDSLNARLNELVTSRLKIANGSPKSPWMIDGAGIPPNASEHLPELVKLTKKVTEQVRLLAKDEDEKLAETTPYDVLPPYDQ